jgi:hypothetical protein
MGEVRHAEGPKESRWWRLHPERWLESLVVKKTFVRSTISSIRDGDIRRCRHFLRPIAQ